jgi:hypothetical protein
MCPHFNHKAHSDSIQKHGKDILGSGGRNQGLSTCRIRYSEEHRNMTFAQAQALYRVFCNRTLIDFLPQKEPEQCPCGQEPLSARHLFESCNLLDTARSEIFDKTAKDMHEGDFFLNPNNTERICHFLKRTRLGFSKGINWDDKLSDKERDDVESGAGFMCQ